MRRLLHLLLWLPLFTARSDRWLQNLLMAHADALAGEADLGRHRAGHAKDMPGHVEALLTLAEDVSRVLVRVEPSDDFVARLERELRATHGTIRLSMWQRVRSLPPRTQIAAGIGGATLTAGVVLLASRSLPDMVSSWRSRWTAAA